MKQVYCGLKHQHWLQLLFLCCVCMIKPAAYGQLLYEPQQFIEPNSPIIPGRLGQLYDPVTYLITNVPTDFHGNQNVYGQAYLVTPNTEFSSIDPKPFDPGYTTGLALSSPVDHSLALYGPIQVAGLANSILRPFAGIIPLGNNQANYQGPFNTLIKINSTAENPVKYFNDLTAISALEAAQKFNKFLFETFKDEYGEGWKGIDGIGQTPLSIIIDADNADKTTLAYFDNEEVEIHIPRNPFLNEFKITRVTVGHEMTHGIIQYATTILNQGDPSPTKRELDEGFADILGLSFSDWAEVGHLNGGHWQTEWELSSYNINSNPFNDPLSYGLPNYFQGQYYQSDPSAANYEEHTNGSVETLVFYSLVNGATNSGINVQPLIQGDIEASYLLALKIFFKSFTKKLTTSATYADLRRATLDALIEYGYGYNSYAYNQLTNAWNSVGVFPEISNIACSTKNVTTSLGVLTNIKSADGSININSQISQVSFLRDCENLNPINVFYGARGNDIIDWEGDGIFSDGNNLEISKYGVSIFKFTQLCRDWFENRFGQNGADGNGNFHMNMIVEPGNVSIIKYNPSETLEKRFEIHLPMSEISVNRDHLSKSYFKLIDFFRKSQDKQSSSEWKTIVAGLGNIFALQVKRDYEKFVQNPQADDIWTLFSDQSDPSYYKDFFSPKSYGQAAVYKGQYWDDNFAERNAGILEKLYELLGNGAEQYSTDEYPELKYTIFPQDLDLVVKVLWDAYMASNVNSTIEEFRAITLKVLHDVVPGDFINSKPKEYIAFYDAWAAVLGLPDYASTLKHTPDEGDSEYPWTVKVGTEVEYPLYESERLFEVSKSPTFNDSEAPVYQFVSSAAPNQMSSMVYGYVNLEPNQTYYIHSRLSKSGDPRLGCPVTDDPVFCEQLQSKIKWTITYDFKTDNVKAVSNLVPQGGTEIPAWKSPISWEVVKGADGYDLNVTDLSGKVTPQTITHESLFDPDNAQEVISKTLALSKNTSYNWNVTARRRLGSEWAVHVLADGKTLPFQEEEKEALPNAYGEVSAIENFKTDTPKIQLSQPADGQHVPMIGSLQLTADLNDRADKYYHRFYFNGDQDDAMDVVDSREKPFSEFWVNGLKLLEDKHIYAWTFAPMHSAVEPFMPEEETGEIPPRFHFKVDKDLIAKPAMSPENCIDPGVTVSLAWGEVKGATGYQYRIVNALNNQEIAKGIYTFGSSPVQINGASEYPGQYLRKISAGVKDINDNWVFGPEAVAGYKVSPPAVTTLSPSAQTVPFDNDNSIHFKWLDPTNTGSYLFSLAKVKNNNGLENIVTDMEVGNVGATVPNLEFEKNYKWGVRTKSSYGCIGPLAASQFQTEKEPDEFDLGFTLEVEDLLKDGTGFHNFDYSIKVFRPDGNLDFVGTGMSNTDMWLQVDFVPGEGQLYNGNMNGQIKDQTGDYTVELEITSMCQNCADPAASPKIILNAKEYKRPASGGSWTLNKTIPTVPADPHFPGRVKNAKRTIQFHYQLP
ncbi:M4 family metallopeptidase [Dyadobacter luticola]|uniref:Fibronectin type-III domain-containing protein n=1 Tax=Dyadobacter luticola TaxID=1979387 RepID=A0A5R9L115_9BACT|nr:M4 family metallopeptidase [Dyadobacter luticola]TLV02213.1 hypothetical protein FEN17_00805 [Dyadobacter luticola]